MAVGGIVLVLMSRGDNSSEGDQSARDAPAKSAANPNESAKPVGSGNQPAESSGRNEPDLVLPESTCPPELGSNCVVASGRVIYVEKVDPDGDGDTHFVTAGGSSVTGPGVTIFDARPELRPDPLPGVGDLVGGAGPVYPGHAGQKQIEVVEFHVAHGE